MAYARQSHSRVPTLTGSLFSDWYLFGPRPRGHTCVTVGLTGDTNNGFVSVLPSRQRGGLYLWESARLMYTEKRNRLLNSHFSGRKEVYSWVTHNRGTSTHANEAVCWMSDRLDGVRGLQGVCRDCRGRRVFVSWARTGT